MVISGSVYSSGINIHEYGNKHLQVLQKAGNFMTSQVKHSVSRRTLFTDENITELCTVLRALQMLICYNNT